MKMCNVTIEQLCEHYDKVVELRELQSTIDGMKEYRTVLSKDLSESDLLKKINLEIARLDKKIIATKSELEMEWTIIEKSLYCINDDIAINAARLHYRDGMTWADIAYITKYSSEEGIKSRVSRALKKHGIKNFRMLKG